DTGEITNVPHDGEFDPATGRRKEWMPVQVEIPFPGSINMQKFADPSLTIELTELPSIVVSDVSANTSSTVMSAAGQFTVEMTGGEVILIDPADDDNTLTTTINSYTSPNEIKLDDAVPWTSENNVLEIIGFGKIHFDLVGTSFLRGEWAQHVDDYTG